MSKELFILSSGLSQDPGSIMEKIQVNGERTFAKKEEKDEKKKDKSGLFFFLIYLFSTRDTN